MTAAPENDPLSKNPLSTDPLSLDSTDPSGRQARSRLPRIALLAVLVFGVEYRFAPPAVLAADPDLWATPWAMMFLMFPVALGVWTFEQLDERRGSLSSDGLWGILLGTGVYLGMTLLDRLI